MLVNEKTVIYCCKYCWSDFGHSNNSRAKTKLRRQLKARERRTWKKEITW